MCVCVCAARRTGQRGGPACGRGREDPFQGFKILKEVAVVDSG